jgi:hypothetical protein
MSKFGWSYPPGVTENMLPGNSKAEQEQENLVESIYEAIKAFRKFYDSEGGEGDTIEDQVASQIEAMLSEAYAKGKADAQSDEALVHELQPTHADDLTIFLESKGLKEEFLQWLSTQPLRS